MSFWIGSLVVCGMPVFCRLVSGLGSGRVSLLGGIRSIGLRVLLSLFELVGAKFPYSCKPNFRRPIDDKQGDLSLI